MDRTHQPFDPKEPSRLTGIVHKKRFSVQQGGLVVGTLDLPLTGGRDIQGGKSGRMRVLKEKKERITPSPSEP